MRIIAEFRREDADGREEIDAVAIPARALQRPGIRQLKGIFPRIALQLPDTGLYGILGAAKAHQLAHQVTPNAPVSAQRLRATEIRYGIP